MVGLFERLPTKDAHRGDVGGGGVCIVNGDMLRDACCAWVGMYYR
jgi:hypothetical protein